MSTRHRADALRSDKADEILLRPDKDLRSKEHRRARHRASQEMHTVEDPDAAVFTRPKFDHPPRVKPKKKTSAVKHWKTKAWKRRNIERRRRNLERERLLQEAA